VKRWLPLALLALSCGCASAPVAPRQFAHARFADDFESYQLRRVGLLPFCGETGDEGRARALQQTFAFELARTAPYELVALDEADVAEIAASDPLRRGAYDPRALLAMARRFRLDGLLIGTVTQMQLYTPQALAVELELVATETGQPVWSSQVALDATDPALRENLERWLFADASEASADAQLAWLSPERLARFAARAVAETL
jgi:hypothetical protein